MRCYSLRSPPGGWHRDLARDVPMHEPCHRAGTVVARHEVCRIQRPGIRIMADTDVRIEMSHRDIRIRARGSGMTRMSGRRCHTATAGSGQGIGTDLVGTDFAPPTARFQPPSLRCPLTAQQCTCGAMMRAGNHDLHRHALEWLAAGITPYYGCRRHVAGARAAQLNTSAASRIRITTRQLTAASQRAGRRGRGCVTWGRRSTR